MKSEAAMIPGTIPLGGAGYDVFILVPTAVVTKETLCPAASKVDFDVLANSGMSVRFMGTLCTYPVSHQLHRPHSTSPLRSSSRDAASPK